MAPSALKADWRNTNKSGSPVSTVVFLSITAGRTGGSSGWRNVDPSLHRQRKASLQAAAKRDRAAPSPAPRGRRPGWRNNRGIRSRSAVHVRHPHSPHTCTRPLLRGTDIKAASGHPLDKLTAEATRVDDTGDIHVLRTQGKPYPPALRHRRKRGKQPLPSLPAVPAEPKSRYPAAELRVHIQKTDDTRTRNAFKPFRQRIKQRTCHERE